MSRSNIDTTANGEKYQTDRLIVAFCIDIKKLGSKKLELEIAAINNTTSQEHRRTPKLPAAPWHWS